RIQRVKLEYVVMKRTHARARPEIARISATRADARTITRAIREIACAEPLRKALCGPGDVECCPVKRIGPGAIGGILDVVEDHGICVESFGSVGGIAGKGPVEFERGRFVVAATRMFHGNLSTIGPSVRRN